MWVHRVYKAHQTILYLTNSINECDIQNCTKITV